MSRSSTGRGSRVAANAVTGRSEPDGRERRPVAGMAAQVALQLARTMRTPARRRRSRVGAVGRLEADELVLRAEHPDGLGDQDMVPVAGLGLQVAEHGERGLGLQPEVGTRRVDGEDQRDDGVARRQRPDPSRRRGPRTPDRATATAKATSAPANATRRTAGGPRGRRRARPRRRRPTPRPRRRRAARPRRAPATRAATSPARRRRTAPARRRRRARCRPGPGRRGRRRPAARRRSGFAGRPAARPADASTTTVRDDRGADVPVAVEQRPGRRTPARRPAGRRSSSRRRGTRC
jgi:hypothetical protein